jgi:hypothetical protein
MNKKQLISHFTATLAGLVLCGVLGTALGETFGYSHAFLYLFGLHGHRRLAELVSKKVK